MFVITQKPRKAKELLNLTEPLELPPTVHVRNYDFHTAIKHDCGGRLNDYKEGITYTICPFCEEKL